jgi:hypothetical protein
METWRNDGHGRFTLDIYPTGFTSDSDVDPGVMIAGDFNQDCVADLVVSSGGGCWGGLNILYGDNDGGFGLPVAILPASTSAFYGMAALGPVGDQHALAVVSDCNGGDLSPRGCEQALCPYL